MYIKLHKNQLFLCKNAGLRSFILNFSDISLKEISFVNRALLWVSSGLFKWSALPPCWILVRETTVRQC